MATNCDFSKNYVQSVRNLQHLASSIRCSESCVRMINVLTFCIESPKNIELLDGSKRRVLNKSAKISNCADLRTLAKYVSKNDLGMITNVYRWNYCV